MTRSISTPINPTQPTHSIHLGDKQMTAKLQIVNSNHESINLIPESSAESIAQQLTEAKATWIVVGKVAWDNTDDVVGVRTDEYNDDVHSMLRAVSDTFFWGLYD